MTDVNEELAQALESLRTLQKTIESLQQQAAPEPQPQQISVPSGHDGRSCPECGSGVYKIIAIFPHTAKVTCGSHEWECSPASLPEHIFTDRPA